MGSQGKMLSQRAHPFASAPEMLELGGKAQLPSLKLIEESLVPSLSKGEFLAPFGDAERVLAFSESIGESRAADVVKYFEEFNKAPYHPQKMRHHLEDQYGNSVKAHTMAVEGDPNFALAMSGKAHSGTGVYFDSRTFPIFEKHVIYETRLLIDTISKNSSSHMREATRHLRASIERGEINPARFNEDQLSAIMRGDKTIPNCTWHHHQETGRLQLLNEKIHKTAHKGGVSTWKTEKK